MTAALATVALSAGAVNVLAAAIGAWCWYRWSPSRAFWVVLRVGQVAAVVVAVLAAVLWAAGRRSGGGLLYLYALLPLAIGLVAEQLRLASAEAVLAARGLDGAGDVGRLPDPDQRELVLSIVRREIGVMALAAAVVCVLELRAAATAHGL